MSESVKVIVRCRPMNTREKDLKCKEVIVMDSARGQCSIRNPSDNKAPPKSFTFDGAYFTDSTTENIYADIGYPLVEGVTEGYNGTIFAYGQTGCGKSFSMQGIQDPTTQRGIIPRAFQHIFETIEVLEGIQCLVHASYLEIYNEEIRDLLGKDVKQKLELKEHPDKGVYVQGQTMHLCKNVADCEKIMLQGWKNRATGSTLMNADSSRSHSIFSIHMERSEKDDDGEEHIRAAKLNLVDLAGSERQAKTGATGDRLKEATKINLSLSALGNVISALVDGKSKHIPYRDSKLTRLLQDSLGGNTKTLMVACLSPADNNYDETLSTLRYANRAKNIKNKPKINEDPKDALLREYQEEITKLKAMLRGEIPMDLDGVAAAGQAAAGGRQKVVEKVVYKLDEEKLAEEKQKIAQEYDSKLSAMKQQHDQVTMNNELLAAQVNQMSRIDGSQEAAGVYSPGQESDSDYAGLEESGISPVMDGSVPMSVEEMKAAQLAAVNGTMLQDPQQPQRAVHITTVRRDNAEPGAPQSSPNGEHDPQHDEALRSAQSDLEQDALLRLQQLQEAMVGGQEANNEEKKEKRRKRKKYADERTRKILEFRKLEDRGVMLQVYEDLEGQIKERDEVVTNLETENTSLKSEVQDLSAEFENDRQDYLDSIRKQTQELKLLQAIIDKIHPCLRRDCNYVNLDKIKAQCVWDEDGDRWTLPKMVIEKTKLPPAGIMPGGRQEEPRRMTNGDVYEDLRSEDRYLQKLQNSSEQDLASNYFKSKRTDKLLHMAQDDRYNRNLNNTSPGNHSPLLNGVLKPPAAWHNAELTDEQLRAAQVHGQISNDELPLRKPTRLESLPQPSNRARKKKKPVNTMEAF